MRYTPPFAEDILKELKSKNIDEIIAISMYPHYSTTTTKSSIEDLKSTLKKIDFNPKLKIIDRYYNTLEYVKIQVSLIKEPSTESKSIKNRSNSISSWITNKYYKKR